MNVSSSRLLAHHDYWQDRRAMTYRLCNTHYLLSNMADTLNAVGHISWHVLLFIISPEPEEAGQEGDPLWLTRSAHLLELGGQLGRFGRVQEMRMERSCSPPPFFCAEQRSFVRCFLFRSGWRRWTNSKEENGAWC